MIIASIDIGTNTVLLLIARIDRITNHIVPILNKYRLPRIGYGTKQSGVISQEKLNLLDDVLIDYKKIINEYKCEKILVTGTNAFRIAKNTPDIIYNLKNKFDFNLKVVSGDEEAEMAYFGAISNIEQPGPCAVIDIGGSSTEIIIGQSYEITSKASLQLGSVSSTELLLKHSPPIKSETEQFQSEIRKLLSTIEFKRIPHNVVAIAGTVTTLVCMKLGLTEFSEEKIENSNLSITDMNKIVNELSKLSASENLDTYGKLLQGREDIIFAGAFILYQFMDYFDIDTVNISTRGIRYGAIQKYLLELTKH